MVGKGALFSKLTASLIEVSDQQNIGWKNASCTDQQISHVSSTMRNTVNN